MVVHRYKSPVSPVAEKPESVEDEDVAQLSSPPGPHTGRDSSGATRTSVSSSVSSSLTNVSDKSSRHSTSQQTLVFLLTNLVTTSSFYVVFQTICLKRLSTGSFTILLPQKTLPSARRQFNFKLRVSKNAS